MSLSLQIIKFLAIPTIVGSVVTPLALMETFSSNKNSKAVKVEELKKNNCYIFVSEWNKTKNLLVCQNGSPLQLYYLEKKDGQTPDTTVQEVEKIMSSAGQGVTAKLLRENKNVVVTVESSNTNLINPLSKLAGQSLSRYCHRISEESKLICGSNQISLTKWTSD